MSQTNQNVNFASSFSLHFERVAETTHKTIRTSANMAKSTSSIASSSSSSSSRSSASSSASITSTQSSASSMSSSSNDNKPIRWTQNSQMDRRKRLAANARERKRMHLLNKAYDELRRRLVDAENKSKYDVLVQAKEYIRALSAICEKFDKQIPITTTATTTTTTATTTTTTTTNITQQTSHHHNIMTQPSANELKLESEPYYHMTQQVSPISLIKHENKLDQYQQENQAARFYQMYQQPSFIT